MLDMMQEQEQVLRRVKDENISKTQVVTKKLSFNTGACPTKEKPNNSLFKENRILSNFYKEKEMDMS
jgi:hypothetical protein